jgi:hypothetical protein
MIRRAAAILRLWLQTILAVVFLFGVFHFRHVWATPSKKMRRCCVCGQLVEAQQ